MLFFVIGILSLTFIWLRSFAVQLISKIKNVFLLPNQVSDIFQTHTYFFFKSLKITIMKGLFLLIRSSYFFVLPIYSKFAEVYKAKEDAMELF